MSNSIDSYVLSNRARAEKAAKLSQAGEGVNPEYVSLQVGVLPPNYVEGTGLAIGSYPVEENVIQRVAWNDGTNEWDDLGSPFSTRAYVDDKASLLQSEIDAIEAGQVSGVIGFADKSTMEADTGQDVNTIAIVTNDTAENNGYYRWDGTEWIASDFLGSDVLLFTDSLTEADENWVI